MRIRNSYIEEYILDSTEKDIQIFSDFERSIPDEYNHLLLESFKSATPMEQLIFFALYMTRNGNLNKIKDILLVKTRSGKVKNISTEGVRKRIMRIRESFKRKYIEYINSLEEY